MFPTLHAQTTPQRDGIGRCRRHRNASRNRSRDRKRLVLAALPVAGLLLAACGSGSAASPQGSRPASSTATSPGAAATASPSQAAAGPPAVVAVTKGGALVILDSASGSVAKTLVPSGVVGDEISVSPDGTTVYFAAHHGCSTDVESVPVTGGSPTLIGTGSLPAISPDGAKLAMTRQPSLATGCIPNESDLTAQYKLVVRTLSSGSRTVYPMLPAGQSSGLPYPISHLSWAPDDTRLAVSISQAEDNEGWNLVILDTATAKYYLSGAGDTYVPVTGRPNARDSYLREGVFMPDGNLFVSRACCAGVPVRNTSRLMWEVNTAGTLIHQVAIGFADLDHTSLDVSASGKWLLYLAGDILYVSHDGNTPTQLTTGLIAAAWQ
jgi:hypothetical protein